MKMLIRISILFYFCNICSYKWWCEKYFFLCNPDTNFYSDLLNKPDDRLISSVVIRQIMMMPNSLHAGISCNPFIISWIKRVSESFNGSCCSTVTPVPKVTVPICCNLGAIEHKGYMSHILKTPCREAPTYVIHDRWHGASLLGVYLNDRLTFKC